MRATILHDIVLEDNGISIIKSGTSIIVSEEHITESFLSKLKMIAKYVKNPRLLSSKAVVHINNIIDNFLSLPFNAPERDLIEKEMSVVHNIDNKGRDDDFTTVVKCSKNVAKRLFSYIKNNSQYDCIYMPFGQFCKIYISHLTEDDYKASNQPKQYHAQPAKVARDPDNITPDDILKPNKTKVAQDPDSITMDDLVASDPDNITLDDLKA